MILILGIKAISVTITLKPKLPIPIIIVNFKNYLEATGKKAIELARMAEKASK
jgi:hypothetical protein